MFEFAKNLNNVPSDRQRASDSKFVPDARLPSKVGFWVAGLSPNFLYISNEFSGCFCFTFRISDSVVSHQAAQIKDGNLHTKELETQLAKPKLNHYFMSQVCRESPQSGLSLFSHTK